MNKSKEEYTELINNMIKQSGFEVPKDLVLWSYRWRCYIYSNVIPAVVKDHPIDKQIRDLTDYIMEKVRDDHALFWVRHRMYPVDSSLTRDTARIHPKFLNYVQFIIWRYFQRCLDRKDYVIDDYMLDNLPELKKFIQDEDEPMDKDRISEGFTQEGEPDKKVYKLTPRFDFWEPDHYIEFKKLKDKYAGKNNLRFMEIGTMEGRTATWLLDEVLTGENCSLTCIEPDPPANMYHNLAYHKQKAIIKKDYSRQVLVEEFASHKEYYDFIYTDADHNAPGVLQDGILCWPLLKTGGEMFFDDYEMEIHDPWFYIMHKEFKEHKRLMFIHPHVGIDAFLNVYRGQYKLLFKNYLVGIEKVADIGSKNIDNGEDNVVTMAVEVERGSS